MSSTHSELMILGELGKAYPVEVLNRSGSTCLVASDRLIPLGTVARIRLNTGILLGEVVACEANSQHFQIALRSLRDAAVPVRPTSVLQDLLSLNAHLMACEA